MRRAIPLVLVLALTMAFPTLAAEGEARVTATEIRQLLPGKIVAPELGEVASGSGQMLLLGRDSKTRQMEWYFLDLSPLKVLNQGKAPFAGFEGFALSPDGGQALVRARHPASVWVLNTRSGAWTRTFDAPETSGFRFTSNSPLYYSSSNQVTTIVDRVDEEDFVQDSLVLRFVPSPFSVAGTLSLQKLSADAEARVPEPTEGRVYWPGSVRQGEDGSAALVLEARKKESPEENPVDYLFLASADGSLTLLDQAPAMLLLDYDSSSGRVLYRKNAGEEKVLMLAEGGKTSELSRVPMLVGALLPKNRISTMSVETGRLEFFTGLVGQGLKKVKTVPGVYTVAFLQDGERVLLVGERDLRIVPLSQE